MNEKRVTATIAAAAAFVVVGSMLFIRPSSAPLELDDAIADGIATTSNVYRLPDDAGAWHWVAVNRSDAGVNLTELTGSPCVERPAGAVDCRRSLADGGTTDPGDENVFPRSMAVGAQCAQAACVTFFGDL